MNSWYEKLGFDSNPFSIKPAALQDDIIAYDVDYIYKKIQDSEMLFIEGEYGTGKTTILKNIISNFRGKNKIIYYSFNEGRAEFNVKALLEGANSLLRRLSGLKTKNVIMLLDEAHEMEQSDAKQLIKYYKDGTIQSIVFVSHAYDETNLPEEVETYLNGNVMRTISLTDKEAIDLVRSRVGKLKLFSDKTITKLFKISNKNPRRLLENCEDVAKYAVEIGDNEVTDFHISEILGVQAETKQKEELIEKEKPAKKQKKPREAKPAKEKEIKEPVAKEITPALEENPAEELNKEKLNEDIVVYDVEEQPEHKPETGMKHEETVIDEPKSEAISQKPVKEKKFKINKLIKEDKKDTLGTISEKESAEEEIPEYKIYFFDN